MARILAIHAHPDDVEILAGGTLSLLADAGHSITVASFTPGDCGSHELGSDEIAGIRRREATRAAARMGGRYICLEMRDMAIFNDDRCRRHVTEFLRQARPDLVLTASPVDYHCDHEMVSMLVRDACFAAPVPNYRTGKENPAAALPSIPHLYYIDPIGGVDREGKTVMPEFVVNVESVLGSKRAALAEHASQREWLRRHHGTDDYLDQMEQWTRQRGRLVGWAYGEGFRQYRGHSYPPTPLVQELIGTDTVRRVE